MVLLVGDDFMGLAIDGNEVHGIAIAGNAFTHPSKENLIGKKISGLMHASALSIRYENQNVLFMKLIYLGPENTGTIIAEWNYQCSSPLVAVKRDSGNIATNNGNSICWFNLKDLTIED